MRCLTWMLLGTALAPTAFAQEPTAEPVDADLDAFLATPAEGYLWEMPVLVISYIPTADGVNVDASLTGCVMTVADLEAEIRILTARTKFALEEGSRFRAHKDPEALPSLGYRIVDTITIHEPLPLGMADPGNADVHFADYNAILSRVGIERYVEDLGVKEVWLWGYHYGSIAPAESNMASPTTGDISNSYRFPDDMPVLDKTYILYNYNFTRGAGCALENHMHQIESQLIWACQRQDGNLDLYEREFIAEGRCGWSHMPPNTRSDYDWANPTVVESDIEDWRPDGAGEKLPTSCEAWASKTYDWPDGDASFGDWHQITWFIYWMQSHPGRGNRIPHGEGWVTNWWTLVGDWDGCVRSGFGLHAPSPTP